MDKAHLLELEGVEPPLPAGLVSRIWGRDASAWAAGDDDPADRLGWLELPTTMAGELEELRRFADQVASDAETVVLLGMGGSSLAPEMYARTFDSAEGHPSLIVLDSTHPDRIRSVGEALDPQRTAFIVSSKSGTTMETISLYRHFRDLVEDGARYAAITDPGSPLEQLAEEEGFRHTFLNPPDIGGRYSALSLFGLVPAAVCGLDLEGLLQEAARMAEAVSPGVAEEENPGLLLGAALADLVGRGRDKATFLISDPIAAFGDWVEQLLAESTGKRGTGIVPIVHEPQVDPSRYGHDRIFVHVAAGGDRSRDTFLASLAGAGHPVIRLEFPEPIGLGGQIFLWEFATAVAGSILGINAFDQPDVEAAKEATRLALEEQGEMEWAEQDPDQLFEDLRPGEHAVVLAFSPPTPDRADTLTSARRLLLLEHGVATSGAFGPRYLHSSGQLHKGGPEGLRALVVYEPPVSDLPIPGRHHGFGRLVQAQAVGDTHALRDAGRRTVRTTWKRFAHWTEGR